jgi:hypothetical protein
VALGGLMGGLMLATWTAAAILVGGGLMERRDIA